MLKAQLLLSALFLFNGIVDAKLAVMDVKILCSVDMTKIIEFSYKPKCLQMVINANIELSCIQKKSNTVAVKIRSFMDLKRRDISSEGSKRSEKCETFLILINSLNDLKEVIEVDRSNRKQQFFPFARIYFYNYGHHEETAYEYKTKLKNYLIVNALFGYKLEHKNDKIVVRDLLKSEAKGSNISYKPSDLLHPIVDTHSTKNNFTMSLFSCSPFTFYPVDASEKEIIKKIDGTEFRFVNEVTKNWKKIYKFRDFSRTKLSPYSLVLEDVSNKTSDLAMCSVWLLGKNYFKFDFTTFYEQHCTTFLVPKPIKLNEATAIYTALHPFVGWLLLIYFVLSSILLNFISKMEERLYNRKSQYTEFTRAVMETINTSTSHSVHRFPSQNGQVAAKILLISWIWLSVWLGIVYTTTYASKLTSPGYEKPINTVRQFLDYGLHICGLYINTDIADILSNSINEDYRRLSTRSLIYGENLSYRNWLAVERMCGFVVSRPKENYIAVTKVIDDINLMSSLRIMPDCLLREYTGFALQKYSPYKKLFDWYIRRYQEHGIIQSWYLKFSRQQEKFRRIFSDYPEQDFVRQINLVNVSGSFFLLCTGLLLSVVSFLVEISKRRFLMLVFKCTDDV